MGLDWLSLLKAEAERTSIAAVARRISYARSSVSLALSGKYPGGTAKLEQAVLRCLTNHVPCPYLGKNISSRECKANQSRPMPTGSPHDLAFWRTCQSCPHKKETDNAECSNP